MNRKKLIIQICIFNFYYWLYYGLFFDNYTNGKVLTIIGLTLFSALLQMLLILIDLIKTWTDKKNRNSNILLILIIPIFFIFYVSIIGNR